MSKCCQYMPGMLREPIEVQEQVETSIGGGATDITWQTKFTTQAHMKPLSGNERLYAERLDATTRNRLVMRYRPDLVESDRVVIRGRQFQIRFINNVEYRNRWLEVDLDGGQAT